MLTTPMARILTAVVLIPLVLLLLFKGHFWHITLATAIVAMLALWEYLGLANASGAHTPRILVVIAVAILFGAAFRRPDLLTPVLSSLALLLFIIISFRSPLDRVLFDTAASVFGLLYIGLSLITIPLLWAQENGPSLLLLLFLVVWSGDVAALYVGKNLGKRMLAPRLSPNKTWEGSIASVVASVIVVFLLFWLTSALERRGLGWISYNGSHLHWILLAIVLNIAAQLGDRIESAIKRGAKVKDSGTLLPGHGGVLDRIDALLLAAPVLWYAQLVQQYF
jgi:phosphatidate cytidylyltransferase